MQEVATLERVREVFETLQKNGETPSADRICRIVGGSKTTILKHMHTILGEIATAKRLFDPARGLLELAAENMTAKLWDAAQEISKKSFETRIQSLVTLQTGLFEDLTILAKAEEAANERSAAAEARFHELEAEIATLKDSAGQLTALTQLLKIVPTRRRLPSEQMLHLLRAGKTVDRVEIVKEMVAIGYTEEQIQSAKTHCLNYKYIIERTTKNGLTLRILKKGLEHYRSNELGGAAGMSKSA